MPKRKFREEWLQNDDFKEWKRKVEEDDCKAYCIVCKSTMVTEISTLKRHKSSRRHIEGLALHTASPSQHPPPDCGNDSVTRAEIKLATFLAEHNVPINTIDHHNVNLKRYIP